MMERVAGGNQLTTRPEQPRPDQLPPGWAVRAWAVSLDTGRWYEPVYHVDFGLVHLPSGVEVELRWDFTEPPRDYAWLWGVLLEAEKTPMGVSICAERRPW